MPAKTYDTLHDVSTAPDGHVLDLAGRVAEIGAAVNDHATSIDTFTASIGGTLTADAPGRAKIAAGFFNEVTATSAFAALAIDGSLLKQKATIPGAPTFAIGAEIAHVRIVTVTLKDLVGVALAAAAKATVWISDAAGAAPSAVAPSGGTAISAGVQLKAHTAGVLIDAISTGAGSIGVTLTEAAAKNFYVNVAIGGVIASSAVVAFAG